MISTGGASVQCPAVQHASQAGPPVSPQPRPQPRHPPHHRGLPGRVQVLILLLLVRPENSLVLMPRYHTIDATSAERNNQESSEYEYYYDETTPLPVRDTVQVEEPQEER